MGFFGSTKKIASGVVIDIDTTSVGAACVGYPQKEKPVLYYSTRVPIQPREGESLGASMLRALEDVGALLTRDGAPILKKETGSGSVDKILVSLCAPWQETRVSVHTIAPGKTFTLTKSMVSDIVASTDALSEGRVRGEDVVIATLLNGYAVADPFGKEAKRAEVTILSSTLDKEVIAGVTKQMKSLYHTNDIEFGAFGSLSFRVLKDLYPHEKDFLIINVSGEGTELTSVKRGILVDVGSVQKGLNELLNAGARTGHALRTEEEALGQVREPAQQPGYISPTRNDKFEEQIQELQKKWIDDMIEVLRTFAKRHALPRKIFLLANEQARGFLTRILDTPSLHTLWLSDEPLSIIAVTPGQFNSSIRLGVDVEEDMFLSILGLFQQRTIS
jgi:hypothetical protein